MAAMTPIKVGADTDALISHAAHFLGATKKAIVDRAIREFVDRHREEIDAGIRAALQKLDGTNASAVSLMTGLSRERLAELGGVPGD